MVNGSFSPARGLPRRSPRRRRTAKAEPAAPKPHSEDVRRRRSLPRRSRTAKTYGEGGFWLIIRSLEGARMTSPLRLLGMAAALNVSLGLGTAAAQQVMVRHVAAGTPVEVVLNGATVGNG